MDHNKINNKKNQTHKNESILSSTLSFIFIVTLVFAFKSSILDANNIPSGSMIPTLKIGDFLFVNKMRYSIRMPFTEKELFRFDTPKRGDIVTFIPPESALAPGESRNGMFSKRFVKRIIGMPGDTIRIIEKRIESKKGPIYYSFIEYKEKNSKTFQSYEPKEVDSGDLLNDLDNVLAPTRPLFKEKKRNFEHYVLEGQDNNLPFMIHEECDFMDGCVVPEDHFMMVGDNRDDSHDSRAWGFVKREDILGKAMIIYFSIDWKDNTCEYKNSKDLATKGPDFAPKYQGEELFKKCHPTELATLFGPKNYNESIFLWLEKTLLYRIWRMDIRWNRIGKILE